MMDLTPIGLSKINSDQGDRIGVIFCTSEQGKVKETSTIEELSEDFLYGFEGLEDKCAIGAPILDMKGNLIALFEGKEGGNIQDNRSRAIWIANIEEDLLNPENIRIHEDIPNILTIFRKHIPEYNMRNSEFGISPDYFPPIKVIKVPISELRLELAKPGIETLEDKYHSITGALLTYQPTDRFIGENKSTKFYFETALEPIGDEELR